MNTLEKQLIKKVTFLRVTFLLLSCLWFFISDSLSSKPPNTIISLILLIGINVCILFLQKAFFSYKSSIILWFIELGGTAVVIIFTGGVFSPFILMIFNPLFLGFYFKKNINLALHMLWFTFISFSISVPYPQQELAQEDLSYFIFLIFILAIFSVYSLLITTAFNHQSMINDKLNQEMEKNKRLLKAYQSFQNKIQASLDFIERTSHATKYKEVHQLLDEYLNQLFTRHSFHIYAMTPAFLSESYHAHQIESLVIEYYENKKGTKNTAKSFTFKEELIICQMISHYEKDWVIVTPIPESEKFKLTLVCEQLELVKELHKIAVSKLFSDDIKLSLKIREEQNRIAEEMHDRVNSNLFAVSCGIFDVQEQLKKLDDIPESIIEKQAVTAEIMKETNSYLKDIIFRMSEKQSQKNHFKTHFFKSINHLKTLYDISIYGDLDEEIIYVDQKIQTYVFRGINELTSNAVKHGKANHVKVSLYKNKDLLCLEVTNNGDVFNFESDSSSHQGGIGLINMDKMTKSTDGYFKIEPLEDSRGMKFLLAFGGAYDL